HCEGVKDVLAKGPTEADLKAPPDFSVTLDSYKLHDDFLKLVDNTNVDQAEALCCFYNSNRDVRSEDVKNWKKDAATLTDARAPVKAARQAAKQNGADKPKILTDLLKALEDLGI